VAPETWFDLGLYVVGGLGVFMLASLLIGFAARRLGGQATIGASLALYAANVICLGGAVLGLGVMRRKFTWADLGLVRRVWRWYWPLLAVVITLGFLPLRVLLGLLVQWLAAGSLQGLQTRMQVFAPTGQFTWLAFGVTLVGAGVLAPVSEELYFRGLIHRALRPRFSFWLRVLLSTSFFAVAHFDTLAVVASSFVIGAVNAVTYEWTDSLWLPILTHIFNNSLAVVLVYGILLVTPFPQHAGVGLGIVGAVAWWR
jgi:membrane protease YdiL (CAAX protease family)